MTKFKQVTKEWIPGPIKIDVGSKGGFFIFRVMYNDSILASDVTVQVSATGANIVYALEKIVASIKEEYGKED